jgi:hypothetical protein
MNLAIGSARTTSSFTPAVVSWLVFLVLLVGVAILEFVREHRFSPAAWQQRGGVRTLWPDRLRMVDNLLERRLLDGLARDSVARLLGPADSTDYFREYDLVYWLGPERGFIRIDSEWLVVRFGPNGRVSEYRIVRD